MRNDVWNLLEIVPEMGEPCFFQFVNPGLTWDTCECNEWFCGWRLYSHRNITCQPICADLWSLSDFDRAWANIIGAAAATQNVSNYLWSRDPLWGPQESCLADRAQHDKSKFVAVVGVWKIFHGYHGLASSHFYTFSWKVTLYNALPQQGVPFY